MQLVSARIWTRVAVSISCDGNHYNSTVIIDGCILVYIYIYIFFFHDKFGDVSYVVLKNIELLSLVQKSVL